MGLSRTGIGAEYRRDLGQNDGLKHAILTDRETSLDECLRLQASCMAPQGSALADCDFYHSMIIPGGGEDHRPVGLTPNRRRLSRPHRFRREARARDLDRRAASSPSRWNGAARTWWPSSSRKASAETSCRFRKRSLPRSGRSRSLACRASRTASGSSRGKQIKGDAHPRGHLQPAGDRRVRRRSVGLGAPALSVPDKNHLPMCKVLQALRQDRPLRVSLNL